MEDMKVVKIYESSDYEKVIEFLKSVNSINEIEDELFENAIIILNDEEEVVGMITFEMFRNKALIRYFIFDKEVEEQYLIEMYQKFFENLKNKDINRVFVIINDDNIKQMFNDLGFKEYNKEHFYLTEGTILNSKYKKATVMYYQI